jgi:hypothetical protein
MYACMSVRPWMLSIATESKFGMELQNVTWKDMGQVMFSKSPRRAKTWGPKPVSGRS